MAEQQSFRLILGSSSPARRYLLERDGYAFEVRPAHIDEPTHAGYPNPRQLVQHIAWLKAEAVAPEVDEGILLTADTVAWLDGQVIGKPADEIDARRILRFLGGREHELWTGVCLWRRPGDVQLAWQERSLVLFNKLSDAELDAYIASREWQNNSGAYAIKETADPHVRVVQGSVSNVIGLPMETTSILLPRFAALSLPMKMWPE
jgi:septum formation protein